MTLSKSGFLFIILPLAILLSGMSCLPAKRVSLEIQSNSLQPQVEKTLSELEFAYESRSPKDFTQCLDNDFEDRARFQAVLESYFSSVNATHIHFVIDMVVADKFGISVRLHWFKKAVTSSGVVIDAKGLSQFLFNKYPDKTLKLKRIVRENPFF